MTECYLKCCCLKMLYWRHEKGFQYCKYSYKTNKQTNMKYWSNQFCTGTCKVCSWLCKTWETLVNAVWNAAAWKCRECATWYWREGGGAKTFVKKRQSCTSHTTTELPDFSCNEFVRSGNLPTVANFDNFCPTVMRRFVQ